MLNPEVTQIKPEYSDYLFNYRQNVLESNQALDCFRSHNVTIVSKAINYVNSVCYTLKSLVITLSHHVTKLFFKCTLYKKNRNKLFMP